MSDKPVSLPQAMDKDKVEKDKKDAPAANNSGNPVPLRVTADKDRDKERDTVAKLAIELTPPPANSSAPPARPASGKSAVASTLSVAASLVALVAAGGGYYLWMELGKVQQLAGRTGGVSLAQLDSTQQSLSAQIAKSSSDSSAQLANVRADMEKRLADTNGKLDETAAALRSDTQQAVGEMRGALDSAKSELAQQDSATVQSLNDAKTTLAASLQQSTSDLDAKLSEAKTNLASSIEQTGSGLKSEMAAFNNTVAEMKGAFAELRQQTTERIQAAEQTQIQLRGIVAQSQQELQQAVGRHRANWAMTDVEHLLLLANEQTQLEQSPAKAILSLRTADQRLVAMNDPALKTVRDTIAKEISALEQTPAVDVSGTASQLTKLANSVATLPFPWDKAPTVAVEESTTPVTVAKDVANGAWDAVRGLAQAAWDRMRGLALTRESGKVSPPLFAPDQAYFLQQNLRLQLESARLALLRGEATTYSAAIANAQEWTKQYFNNDAPATQSFVTDLGKLATVNLAVTLPDVSGSLHTLRDAQPALSASMSQ